jgi:Toprim domain
MSYARKRTGKADNNPSWWINLTTGQHMCFSCHYKGSLVQLVADVKEFFTVLWGDEVSYDWEAAKAWIASVAEVPIEVLAEQLKELPNYISSAPKPLEMSEARLAVFVDAPEEELSKRNITAGAAQEYGVMWNDEKKAWILPLREPHFYKLIGWQEKGTVDRTFFNRPTGLPKSKTLFGIKNQREDLVVVVESPLDCVRLASAGIHGAVAVCGSNLSDDQAKLLRYSDVVISAFDNPKVDAAGKKASKEMIHWARKYGWNLLFFNYGETGKKDPGDMTNEEIRWGVENAQHYLLGEIAYV